VAKIFENLNAERALLGGVLSDPSMVMYSCDQLNISPESFNDPRHQRLYAEMVRQSKAGRPVDVLSLEAVEKDMKFLTDLIEACTTVAHSHYYAQLVRDEEVKRVARAKMWMAIQNLEETDKPHQEVIEAVQIELATVCEHNQVKAYKLKDLKDAKIEEWTASKDKGFVGVPSSLPGVNEYLGGYRKGVMSILAGYRGEGKSTMSRQEALGMAEKGYKVALYSIEDPADIAAAGIIGNLAGESVFGLDIGKYTAESLQNMDETWDKAGDLPLWIISQPMTITQIVGHASLMKARHGIDFVMIDHIQFIQPYRLPQTSRNDTMATYGGSVVNLAKALDIPVLCLSQLSRDSEKQNRKPRLSDLRDSGTLEQDARQVMILYFDRELNCHVLEIAKNNFGISHKDLHMKRVDGRQRFERINPNMDDDYGQDDGLGEV